MDINKQRERVRNIFYGVCGAHVAVLMVALVRGCLDEQGPDGRFAGPEKDRPGIAVTEKNIPQFTSFPVSTNSAAFQAFQP